MGLLILINNSRNTRKSIDNLNSRMINNCSMPDRKIFLKNLIYRGKRKFKVLEFLKVKTKLLKIYMEFPTTKKILSLISLYRK